MEEKEQRFKEFKGCRNSDRFCHRESARMVERVRVRIVDCNRLWIGRNRGLRAVYCKMQP
jgi:hypothetical protein